MSLPVHRWFRYSAGFSAAWAESVIAQDVSRSAARVLDPFAGSATTLLAAENVGVPSFGVESHPFVARIARAKLCRRSDPATFRRFAKAILADASDRTRTDVDEYPPLIRKCFRDEVLADLDRLRRAWEGASDGSPDSELTWLALVAILRPCSHVGTAQWQYVLPKKSKKTSLQPFDAFEQMIATMHRDMLLSQRVNGRPSATLVQSDARSCGGVPEEFATLVITSPPYPNNYDYADATRLEMTFMREIDGWGDLQNAVRQHLIRSCSQHVPEKAADLEETLAAPELVPIRDDLAAICRTLSEVRQSKGGKKTYHLMVACYFLDMARVWRALRPVCASPCRACFVIGDSAPYAVYVPVHQWLSKLATAAGFGDCSFTKLRDRNVKWKNRKHRVPLCEGELWCRG